jgi:hypothetical protein
VKNSISTTQIGEAQASEQSQIIVNQILKELRFCKTAWRSAFKSQLEVDGYREQLLKACVENNIHSQEQIDRGLSEARKDESDFLPGVGKFVQWCKKPYVAPMYAAIEQQEREENQNRLEHKPINKNVGREAIKQLLKGE